MSIIYQELKHSNIVALYDVLHSERKLTLVFEHCDQVSIFKCNNQAIIY